MQAENSESPTKGKRHSTLPDLKDFDISVCIGCGSFGKVYKAQNRTTNKEYALKIIDKSRLTSKGLDSVLCEAQILSSLNHKNIVRFCQLSETKENVFIFMELIKYGSLFQFMRKRKQENILFTDEEVSKIIGNLLSAIAYIHQKNILHRDIKPENILISNSDNPPSIKLIDFGLSSHFHDYFVKVFSQKCGTLLYMAPELIKGELYSKPVDIWSSGIVMMELLNQGQHPFDQGEKNTKNLIMDNILHPKWKFSEHFTQLAKDFFLKLTNEDPQERYTASQALEHPWITRKFNEDIPMTFSEKMRVINLQNDFSNKIMAIFFVQSLVQKSKKNKIIPIRLEAKKKSALILRNSKTLDIDNNNDKDDSLTSKKDVTFTDDMAKETLSMLLQENLFPLSSSPSKCFRIKNNIKPFNSLNTAMTQSQNFKLQEKNDSSLQNSSANTSGISAKKVFSPTNYSKYKIKTLVNEDNEGPIISPLSQKSQKNQTFSPRNIDSKKIQEKKEIIEVIDEAKQAEKSIKSNEKNNSSSNANNISFKKKIVCISPQHKKNSVPDPKINENIKLDKETLRDLNRYTDKNFIKSIKASFRKLEIIEKINEDNFKHERTIEKSTFSMSPKKNKRSSMLEGLNPTSTAYENSLFHDNWKLPQINSPQKKNLLKNNKSPKN